MQSAQEKIQADLKQSKEKLKVFLKNINNSQFQDLNYSIKTNIILNCCIFNKKIKKPSNLATTYSPRFTNQVPLAMTRFTLEFGMGSGGSTSL